ncbi:CHT4 [[Candida] subhashii]|uniref:CHT4 n=1 Tax=[Candida] subhashii TaxID=561895 RepID=A0A8J5V4Y9_9ASCO|nr:CHT4 [[Candida] subhashii]KAG7665524.1 CHT4 [[Candida] subhashii]
MFQRISNKLHSQQQHSFQLTQCPTMKTGIYFSNWSVYSRNHFLTSIPLQNYTHLFYAFFLPSATTGHIQSNDAWADFQLPLPDPTNPNGAKVTGNLQQLYKLKKLHRGLKTILSIGGWGTAHLFEAVVANTERLNNFINSIVDHIAEYGFDGVDLDWEYPSTPHQGKQFVQLVHALRKALPPQYSISIAAPAGGDKIKNFDLRTMDQVIDFWNVMCYDFAGEGWSRHTGFHSNLFGNNGDNDLCSSGVIQKYLDAGICSDKLILGMPMYGRVFHGAKAGGIGAGFDKSHHGHCVEEDIVDYKKLPIGQESVDLRKVGAVSYDVKMRQVITYDNVQCVRIKANYILSNRLGGGMWWDSAGDDECEERSLVGNFVDQIGGVEKLDRKENIISYPGSNYLKGL